jgi:inosine/xanthosine triphosphate pyrophosphatase family protein
MAELTDEEKDRISHRGRALRALREAIAAAEGDEASPEVPDSR